jgi:hypothetical protein
MNLEPVLRQLRETELLMAEIQRRQAHHVVSAGESMRAHEERMAHVDMRLAGLTYKLGLMSGYFKGTQ